MSLPPGPICYDKRMYINYLSRSEKIKHNTFTRKNMEDREEVFMNTICMYMRVTARNMTNKFLVLYLVGAVQNITTVVVEVEFNELEQNRTT